VNDIGNGDMMGSSIHINVPHVDGDVWCVNKSKNKIVTREYRLLIRLSALCCNCNVPLYLADEIVKTFCQEMECGLVLDTSLINKHCAFLKRMCERFPSPKAQSIQIGIEGMEKVMAEHERNLHESVSAVHYDFWNKSMIF